MCTASHPEADIEGAARGTLVFAPGETEKTASIPLLDSSASTSVETLHLRLHTISRDQHNEIVSGAYAHALIFPEVDTGPPSVTVTKHIDPDAPAAVFYVDVEFSEPTTGFELEDLEVVNGTAFRMAGSRTGNRYLVSVLPDPFPTGDISVRVPAGVATDLLGKANTASEAVAIETVPVGEHLVGAFAGIPTIECYGDKSTPSDPRAVSSVHDALIAYYLHGYAFPFDDDSRAEHMASGLALSATQDGIDVVRRVFPAGVLGFGGTDMSVGIELMEDVTGTVLVQLPAGRVER